MIATFVYLVFRDGIRTLAFRESPIFDVAAWAQTRQGAFRILGITAVEWERV